MTIREAKEVLRISRRENLPVVITTYPPGERCHNGGEYGFGVQYWYRRGGRWARMYWTTAEFDYCGRCAQFWECDHDPDWIEVPTEEVLKDLLDGRFVGIDAEGIYVDATHRRSRK